MEYKTNSFKEAINITLHRYDYDSSDLKIIKKLIENALSDNPNYFTKYHGARDYILSQGKNGIMREMIDNTRTLSNNLDEIIEKYINMFFRNKQNKEIVSSIEQNSDIYKITKRIKYISYNSETDEQFINELWNFFSKVFVGKENYISKEELRYDMLYAALQTSCNKKDNVAILKTINPTSTELTEMDAVNLVEEYVYNGNVEELIDYINTNKILSGLLLQNLFDYAYFKKEEKKNKLTQLDWQLENIKFSYDDIININEIESKKIKQKAANLNIVLDGNKSDYIYISREEALVDVLKNTLCLSIYKNNKYSIDYEEGKLYSGDAKLEDVITQKRIESNEIISQKLLANGLNTTIDDLANIINNLTEKELYFLSHIYVISRSLKDNISKIDNSVYYGTREQGYILNLLDDPNLLLKLKKEEIMEDSTRRIA